MGDCGDEPNMRDGFAMTSTGTEPPETWTDADNSDGKGGNGGGMGLGITNTGWLEYTLDAGYKVTQVDLFHGWENDGRSSLNVVSLEYATSAAPDTYTTIAVGAVYTQPPSDYAKTSIVLDAGGLADVLKLRINFGTVPNDWSGYSEIDVLPEPATLALLGLGGLGLLIRRRR